MGLDQLISMTLSGLVQPGKSIQVKKQVNNTQKVPAAGQNGSPRVRSVGMLQTRTAALRVVFGGKELKLSSAVVKDGRVFGLSAKTPLGENTDSLFCLRWFFPEQPGLQLLLKGEYFLQKLLQAGKQRRFVQRIAQRQGAGGEMGAPEPVLLLDSSGIECVDLLTEHPEGGGEAFAADHKVDVHFLAAF